jgi:hypothetical protein
MMTGFQDLSFDGLGFPVIGFILWLAALQAHGLR